MGLNDMKLRIFVIDDEESVRETFRMHLEGQGHEVVTASEPWICDVYCGRDCEEENPCGHLLLLDYHMPRMTGLEFVEAMARRGCKSATTNKIIMTSNTAAIDMDRVRKVGCQVVSKPLTLYELDNIVGTTVAIADPEQKLADLSAKSQPLSA